MLHLSNRGTQNAEAQWEGLLEERQQRDDRHDRPQQRDPQPGHPGADHAGAGRHPDAGQGGGVHVRGGRQRLPQGGREHEAGRSPAADQPRAPGQRDALLPRAHARRGHAHHEQLSRLS